MPRFLDRLIGNRKQWRAVQARAGALPHDYRIVYGEIKTYVWKFSAGNGLDTVAVLEDLLGLFETGAADGRRALEVTGEDVAAFCDDLLRNASTYTQKWREALNRDVHEKLAGPNAPR